MRERLRVEQGVQQEQGVGGLHARHDSEMLDGTVEPCSLWPKSTRRGRIVCCHDERLQPAGHLVEVEGLVAILALARGWSTAGAGTKIRAKGEWQSPVAASCAIRRVGSLFLMSGTRPSQGQLPAARTSWTMPLIRTVPTPGTSVSRMTASSSWRYDPSRTPTQN